MRHNNLLLPLAGQQVVWVGYEQALALQVVKSSSFGIYYNVRDKAQSYH